MFVRRAAVLVLGLALAALLLRSFMLRALSAFGSTLGITPTYKELRAARQGSALDPSTATFWRYLAAALILAGMIWVVWAVARRIVATAEARPRMALAAGVLAAGLVVASIVGGPVTPARSAQHVSASRATSAVVVPVAASHKSKVHPTAAATKPVKKPVPHRPQPVRRPHHNPHPKPHRRHPKTATSASRCDPNYAGGCVPVGVGDVDCTEIPYTDLRVVGTDVDGLDREGDGVACES